MVKKYFEHIIEMPEKGILNEYPNTSPEDLTTTLAKVPVSGPEWVDRRKENRDSASKSGGIFGLTALEGWEYAHRQGAEYIADAKRDQFYADHKVDYAHERLPYQAAKLALQLHEIAKTNWRLINNFFYSFLKQTPDIDEAVKKIMGPDFNFTYDNDADMDDEIDVDKIENPAEYQKRRKKFIAQEIAMICADHYAAGTGPDWHFDKDENVFIQILRFHLAEMKKTEQELLKPSEIFKSKLWLLLFDAIDSGRYPLKKKVVAERLTTLEVTVVDYMLASLGEIWGDYDTDANHARLASNVPADKLWSVYVHEALHALSGQTEILTTYKLYPSESGSNNLRTGLDMNNIPDRLATDAAKDTRPNFRWLNEAITERITLEITNETDGSYRNERDLLNLIIEHGIAPSVIYQAYFENYYGDGDTAPRPTPALKQLFDDTNKKFGQRFLVDLDLCIRLKFNKSSNDKNPGTSSSVYKAVKLWKELGDNFFPFIREQAEQIRENEK